MRKLVVLAVVIGGIYAAVTIFKSTDKNAFLKTSRERVDVMLSNMTSGSTSDQEMAIRHWYRNGKVNVDGQILASFESFLARKGIPEKISSYEIVSAELVNGDDVVSRYARVDVKVNGARHAMKVVLGSPIQWMD